MLKLPETNRTFKIVDLKSLKANQKDGAFETNPDCSETSVFFVGKFDDPIILMDSSP